MEICRQKVGVFLTVLLENSLVQVADAQENSSQEIPLPEMVLIPGGETEVGSLIDFRAQPIHRVEIESFYISKFEITFEQFDAFSEATDKAKRNDLGWGRGDNPVVDVSWEDATEYAEWLSSITGETYRLPTEVEWEYVARANNYLAQYSWGDEIGANRANCRDCGSQWDGLSTAPVGSFEPNSFGVHDMHGNVWELTSNCYTPTYYEAVSYSGESANPDCKGVVVRGGSWDTDAEKLKIWSRDPNRKDNAYNDVGIRLVKEFTLD